MDDKNIMDWVVNRLPPEVVDEGSARLAELRKRQETIRDAQEADLQRVAARGRALGQSRINKEALISFGGAAMPAAGENAEAAEAHEKALQEQSTVQPAQAVAAGAAVHTMRVPEQIEDADPIRHKHIELHSKQAGGSVPQPISPAALPHQSLPAPGQQRSAAPPPTPQIPRAAPQQAAPLSPAPPLDDWDKYVAGVAARYHFDDAQYTNALSILRDLKRRANQYRMSRADQFARAELMTDARARGESLRQLNQPLDALFAELKARLENLPTREQRSKAGGTAAPAPPNARR